MLIFCAESLKKTSVGAWLTGNDPEETFVGVADVLIVWHTSEVVLARKETDRKSVV